MDPLSCNRRPRSCCTRHSSSLGATLVAAPASAQSFNVDIGDPLDGVPSNAYGAAAGQAGEWNGVPSGASSPLVQPHGTLTSVNLATGRRSWTSTPTTRARLGDDAALLDDFADVLGPVDSMVITGLQDGEYLIYTYGWRLTPTSTTSMSKSWALPIRSRTWGERGPARTLRA